MPNNYFDYYNNAPESSSYAAEDTSQRDLERARTAFQQAAMDAYNWEQQPEQIAAKESGQYSPEQQRQYNDYQQQLGFAAKVHEAAQIRENNRQQLLQRVLTNQPEVRYGYPEFQGGLQPQQRIQRTQQPRPQPLQIIGVEPWYSIEQQRQVTRNEEAKNRLMADPGFSPEEKAEAIQQIEASTNFILQNPSKRITDPNKPQFEEGKEPGKLWAHPETGAIMTTVFGKDGKTPEVKLMLRPDQTAQVILEREKMRAQAARERALSANIFRAANQRVSGRDEYGNPLPPRLPTAEEVLKTVQVAQEAERILTGGPTPGQQTQAIPAAPAPPPAAAPEPSRGITQQMGSELRAASKLGLIVDEEDKRLLAVNPQVGAASIKYKNLLRLGGGDFKKIPQEHKAEALNAARILAYYKKAPAGR